MFYVPPDPHLDSSAWMSQLRVQSHKGLKHAAKRYDREIFGGMMSNDVRKEIVGFVFRKRNLVNPEDLYIDAEEFLEEQRELLCEDDEVPEQSAQSYTRMIGVAAFFIQNWIEEDMQRTVDERLAVDNSALIERLYAARHAAMALVDLAIPSGEEYSLGARNQLVLTRKVGDKKMIEYVKFFDDDCQRVIVRFPDTDKRIVINLEVEDVVTDEFLVDLDNCLYLTEGEARANGSAWYFWLKIACYVVSDQSRGNVLVIDGHNLLAWYNRDGHKVKVGRG